MLLSGLRSRIRQVEQQVGVLSVSRVLLVLNACKRYIRKRASGYYVESFGLVFLSIPSEWLHTGLDLLGLKPTMQASLYLRSIAMESLLRKALPRETGEMITVLIPKASMLV